MKKSDHVKENYGLGYYDRAVFYILGNSNLHIYKKEKKKQYSGYILTFTILSKQLKYQ